MSERDHSDRNDDVNRVDENARELGRLDQAFAVAAVMGAVDVENGSVNGRIATNAAVSAEQQQRREKRRKEDRERAHAIQQMREMLEKLDARIAELEAEIAELREQREAALFAADEAFGRMHKLEDLLETAKQNILTDTEREVIKDALGPEAENITDDAALLQLLEDRIEEEKRIGHDAQEKANRLEQDIQSKLDQVENLTRRRDEISQNPSLSPEEKTAQAQAVLSQFLDDDLRGTETSADNNLHRATDARNNNKRTELSGAESFAWDENPTAPPPVPG